ncbi:MAG: LPS assembly lipoprotein LptE [Gammaproteobacteria bacterium]
MYPNFLRIILLFIFFSLTSCGFHLRGVTTLSQPLQKLYLKTENPYGQLARNLRDYLNQSGIQVTDSPENATTVLQILSENQTQQLLSVSGTQQTRQYALTLVVTFQITDPHGVVLVPPQTLSEGRTFTTLSDQILAGSNEQNTMYQQMRRAIVYDIMNRLSSRDITTLLTNQKRGT